MVNMVGACIRCQDSFTLKIRKNGHPSPKKYCDKCRLDVAKESGGSSGKPENWNYTSDTRKVSKKDGYAWVKVKDKWIPEHRFIMENKLNRSLEKYESVHHINGIRDDNSLENLELWLGGIRYGQRASDIKCHNCGELYKMA